MSLILKTAKNESIVIKDKPISKGGEGSVHEIIDPPNFRSKCAKIYFQQHRSSKREQKIGYMIHNPPPNIHSPNYLICWPSDLLYKGSGFYGFIMPLAYNGSIQLYELCTKKIRGSLSNNSVWNKKFSRTTPLGISSRLKLCVNISISIHCIHSLQKYVLVDMKPQNILVNNEGNICIIDTDSIQISNGKNVIFPCPVATPEYIPPEGKKIIPSKTFITEQWDRFSVAVMYYEILFGLHPYASTAGGKYGNSTTIMDKIQNGLSHLGVNSKYIDTLPPLHNNFNIVPQSIQSLFYRAFKEGHKKPHVRPSAEEWGKTIYKEVRNCSYDKGNISYSNTSVNVKPTSQPLSQSSLRLTHVFCMKCNYENYQIGNFCAECGSTVIQKGRNYPTLKYCSGCGNKLTGKEFFCGNCGENLRKSLN